MRGVLLALAGLLLGACSTMGQVEVSRTVLAHETSDEVSCMAECLDDGSETCDECAADCLEGARASRVASGE